MTDNLDAKTDDELLRMVAELKGFTDIRGGEYGWWGTFKGVAKQRIHNWPTSIADAWELVEEMDFTMKRRNGKLVFIFYPLNPYKPFEEFMAIDPKAPRAITLAYLRVMMQEGGK